MNAARNPVRVSGSDVGADEIAAVNDVFERGYLGMGQNVSDFEASLADFFGRSVVCVSSGTSALQLALQAGGVREGDEVLVPSLTYVAAFQAISAIGAVPKAVDICADTLNMDLEHAESRRSPRTRAVMPVHYAGGFPGINQVRNWAQSRGLLTVEDAAHAFGSHADGGLVGSIGDVVCFSFDPIKNITAGEGGCIVSNDGKLLQLARDARLLGVVGDSVARQSERRLYDYDVVDQGWRYHMNNINAAIGKCQLKKFAEFKERRQHLARTYNEILHGIDSVQLLPYEYRQDEVVPHIYVVRFANEQIRDHVKNDLKASLNVETAIHWYPNHYLTKYKEPGLRLPETERAYARMLTLPLHTRLQANQVTEIAEFVRNLVA